MNGKQFIQQFRQSIDPATVKVVGPIISGVVQQDKPVEERHLRQLEQALRTNPMIPTGQVGKIMDTVRNLAQ